MKLRTIIVAMLANVVRVERTEHVRRNSDKENSVKLFIADREVLVGESYEPSGQRIAWVAFGDRVRLRSDGDSMNLRTNSGTVRLSTARHARPHGGEHTVCRIGHLGIFAASTAAIREHNAKAEAEMREKGFYAPSAAQA